MLHVVHGPFHPALEDAFVARLRDLKKGDPLAPVAVVAPSARLANRLKELALHALPDGVMAVHFHHLMSFARIAAGEGPPVEDDFLLERLIRDLVARDFPRSIYLNHIEGAPQLARSLLGVMVELREGGVDPDVAFQALREGHLGEEDTLKLGEIFALQKAYEAELRKRGWSDRAELVRRAAESPELASFKEILYYGVVELVQVQIDLLRAVSRRHPTRLFYPLAKRPEYAFADDFFVQVVVPMADKVQALDASGVSMPQVDVVHASGTRDEAWACAKRILEWRADGVRFSEIGVVARRLDAYSGPLAAAFSDNEIPFSTSAKRPLDGDPYVAAARSLLTLADGGFSRERVMDLLGSPYFKHSGPADPILWDAFSRALGIGRGADEWKRRLPSSGAVVRTKGERGDDIKLDLPEEQVRTFRKDVDRLLEGSVPPARDSWSQFASWALGLLREFLEPGDAAEAVRDAIERLGDLDRMAGTPTPADRRDTVLRAVSELRAPIGSSGDGVRVLDAMAARGLPFRRLIVLGLNERVFPRFILEDPFIRDSVRTRIATRLGPRIAPKLRGYDEERLLFTLLRESARERLVLSWQRSDDAGRTRVRSTFLDAAGTGVPRPPAEKFASVDRSVLTRKEASILEALTVGAKRLPAALKAFGGDVAAFEQRSTFLALLESSRDAGPADGIVADARRSRALSPTALESFASCPFQYFAKRLLGLEPLDEPESESTTSPLDEGNLYHDFLEAFYKGFQGKMPDSLAAARDAFERTLAEAFQTFEEKRSVRHPLVWEVEKVMMRRVLEAAVAWDLDHLDGFVPARFESKVEGELEVGGKPVRFGGYIDRLDLRSDGAFRVIDYKRSRSKARYGVKMETGVQKGRYVQPPLYFLLAEMMLRGEGRAVAPRESKSGYFFLRDTEEDKDPTLWLEGGLGASAAAFADRLERSLGSIDRGEFVVTPGDHCTHCDFRTACRRHHVPTVLRANRFHESR